MRGVLQQEDLIACSIRKILNKVVTSFPYENGESQKMHVDNYSDFIFMGNAVFMTRILQNLLKNAFEQIRLKGKGEIFIQYEKGENYNYLKIKDTAGSISPSIIENLFQQFTSTKQGGTGVGLSSAKRIMNIFGGDITCHLADKDYIEFILSFPKVEENE